MTLGIVTLVGWVQFLALLAVLAWLVLRNR